MNAVVTEVIKLMKVTTVFTKMKNGPNLTKLDEFDEL